jgi:hypothetical protein
VEGEEKKEDDNKDAKTMQTDDSKKEMTTVETVKDKEERLQYYYKQRLRTPECDAALNADMNLKQITYSQHEFVKTVEVGGMI